MFNTCNYIPVVPSFSGLDDDWFRWKTDCQIQFEMAGLTKVIKSRAYSLSHARENVMVYGFLVSALNRESKVDFCCFDTEHENDGHKAWQNLERYFEDTHLLVNSVRKQYEILDRLTLLPDKCRAQYTATFMECKHRIKAYAEVAVENGIYCPTRPYEDVDWKHKYIENILDPKYDSTKKSCVSKHDYTLWDTIISVKDCDIKHMMNLTGTEGSADLQSKEPTPAKKSPKPTNGRNENFKSLQPSTGKSNKRTANPELKKAKKRKSNKKFKLTHS